MKAIRVSAFGGPEVLEVREVPDPRPQAGEVLVRVRAAGVNPYDTYMRAGTYASGNPPLPWTPGSDAAGTVEAVGAGVELKPGQRVYTAGTITGAYAEKALCKASQVHPLPDAASFAQGAGVWVPYATAYRSLFQLAHARPGETVLVHGASGGVGVAALQLARAAGLVVIGTAGSDAGLSAVLMEGAHHAVNHRSEGYRTKIQGLTGGAGVDVIVEMLANVNLAHDLAMLAHRGRVVVVGSRGPIEINPREIMSREAAVLGVLLWRVPDRDAAEIHAALQAGLANGALRPLVGAELPLASAPEAHRRVMEPGARGKIVLVP
ncbi:MAG TPA: NADPH:quinone reductase [Gemmatimonadales bacterium]|nr:NADPH:quinone reductase [Gemmatimonadales bacterium]